MSKRYMLRVSVEGVDKNDDCERCLDNYGTIDMLLFESDDSQEIENLFAELQHVSKEDGDWEDNKRQYTEYTVFIFKEDDYVETGQVEESHFDTEEWNLGRYTNLKRAKIFLRHVIKETKLYLNKKAVKKCE